MCVGIFKTKCHILICNFMSLLFYFDKDRNDLTEYFIHCQFIVIHCNYSVIARIKDCVFINTFEMSSFVIIHIYSIIII
jgi:hypothetical protein